MGSLDPLSISSVASSLRRRCSPRERRIENALLADALLSLYEATFDPRWVDEARALADDILGRSWDDDDGLFHDAPDDADPLVRRRG